MRKYSPLALVISAVLYSHTASTSEAQAHTSQWQAPANLKEIIPLEQYKWTNAANQTVRKQQRIFTPEKGIYGEHAYIVQLNDEPIATYSGNIAGHQATAQHVQQARSQSLPLNLKHGPLASYKQYLDSKRSSVLNAALNQQGLNLQAERTFSVALNGFTTRMTQDQAERLANVSGVKFIKRVEVKQLHTHNTIGDTGAPSVWENASTATGNMGEGVVVGILDTGINTDHPSFAAQGDDGYVHVNPLGAGHYLGDCQANAGLCNDKLIGVYSYPEITSVYSDPEFSETRPENGEDYHSHGSHVAGTTAGNILYDIPFKMAEGQAQSSGIETNLKFEQVSGMAPHANIISYQVCWPGNSGDPYAGCPTSAIISAIEQATIDNVDVINFSIGGFEQDPWSDPTEQAFLNAAKSGVFVAAAAGNSGPDLMTADHSSPWLTTVAAHTASSRIDFSSKEIKDFTGGTSALGDMQGASVTFEDITGLVVDAENFENPNERYEFNIHNCDSEFPAGTFDLEDNPDTEIDESAQNVIVLCRRSSNPLYFKSLNVQAGGAEGIIIYNQSSYHDTQELPAVPHAIPGIHLTQTDGLKVKEWLETGDSHTATITGSQAEVENLDDMYTAYFSSRGPSYFGFNTLFVDIAAPGVDVYAPSSDDQPFTLNPASTDWQNMSGTSMASPHVAGAAAILRQAHPQWSVMEIQSALLMTSGNDLKNSKFLGNYDDSGFESALQDVGAGRMRVDLADKAGLVLDESMEEMAAADPAAGGFVERLNTAYMVNTDCVNECSWVRTFKATKDGTWRITAETRLGNFEITTQPSEFTIKAGEEQSVIVTAKSISTSSALDYVSLTGNQGVITLSSDNGSPELSLPVWTHDGDTGLPSVTKVEAHRRSGTAKIGPMITGDITDIRLDSYGLIKGDLTTKVLPFDTTGNDPFDDAEQVLTSFADVPEGAPSIISHVIGNNTSRVLLFMGQDLNGDGIASGDELLCQSTSYNATNFCAIEDPNAGSYWTVVMNLDSTTPEEGHEISVATAVLAEDNGNLTASAPAQVAGFESYQIDLSYNIEDMEVGDFYFGGIDVGSTQNDAGNIGFVPVIINQIDKDVTMSVDKQTVKVGDTVDFNVSVIANNEEDARELALNLEMPAGVKVIPESVIASDATPGAVELTENGFTMSGTQHTTKDVERAYTVTTSVTDEQCTLEVAGSPYPTYLDLRPLGWRTLEEFEGNYRNVFEYSLKDLMNTNEDVSIPFFNLNHFDTIKISPAGVVYWGERRLNSTHNELPDGYAFLPLPEHMIAPYWVGDHTVERVDSTSGNHAVNAGLTPTYSTDREWLVLEWDNISRTNAPEHNVDFEAFLRTNINYEPGEFEMLFAYNNLNMADNSGSIGFKSYLGRMFVEGLPVDISAGDSIAFNDLGDVIEDDVVVCMDYQGPEQSKFEISFQGYITEQAAGGEQQVKLTSSLVGAEDEMLDLNINVAGNLEIAELSDMTMEQGQSISFDVHYADANNTSNVIEVMGDNFSYEVSSHESGATVTLTPNSTFYGELPVEVMVRDNVASSDSASTAFTITVNQGDAPVVEPEQEDSSSGFFSSWLLSLVGLSLFTRQRRRK